MASLMSPISELSLINNPNIVKVVTDQESFSLYFSRSPIPYKRNDASSPQYYRHIGIYAYKKEFLLRYTSLRPSELEKAESLEQLRALENGFSVKVMETDSGSEGIDTQEQLEVARKKIKDMEL